MTSTWRVVVEAVVAVEVAVLSALLIPVVEPVSVVALALVASVLLATAEATAAVVPVVFVLFTASRVVVTPSFVEGAPVPFPTTGSVSSRFHRVPLFLAKAAIFER